MTLQDQRRLFLTVLLGVRFGGFFTVVSGVRCVSPRRMSVVRALLMMSALIMFGSFLVVASSMGVMFRRLLVVFGSFLRHGISSSSATGIPYITAPKVKVV